MEWQNFLNLCICQENQLQHIENYRRVSLWAGLGEGGDTKLGRGHRARGVAGPDRGHGGGGRHQGPGWSRERRPEDTTGHARIVGDKASHQNGRAVSL